MNTDNEDLASTKIKYYTELQTVKTFKETSVNMNMKYIIKTLKSLNPTIFIFKN